jgi:hypothetical protein
METQTQMPFNVAFGTEIGFFAWLESESESVLSPSLFLIPDHLPPEPPPTLVPPNTNPKVGFGNKIGSKEGNKKGNKNGNRYRLERFDKAMSGTG